MKESFIGGLECVLRKHLPATFVDAAETVYHFIFGDGRQWIRIVMDEETRRYVRKLDCKTLDVLEISPSNPKWKDFGFAEYISVQYPEYDICKTFMGKAFDLIIAEQVLEHVLYPYRAVRNIYRMLNPGGIAIITTPFLVKIHNEPVDCSRWTEMGLKCLLEEGGFEPANIETGSWGNRKCIVSNFYQWTKWVTWKHYSLKNEPCFPASVWAFAKK